MKIHHVTMPVSDPAHVAKVLAELVGGMVAPLHHMENSFMVLDKQDLGTLIEVWPRNVRADVGQDALKYDGDAGPERWPHHAYISVAASRDTIVRVLEREGWPYSFSEQPFPLLRCWIEGQTVVELADPAMAEAYVGFFRAMAERARG